MEITTRLPISQWYFHDLEWWGLDYPPLTAYHSYLCGLVGSYINPDWFALHTSRGIDDEKLKIFMRATVIVSEYLIYIPAVVIFVRRFSRLQNVHTWESSVALAAILMSPSLILIDHVHFQYNTVMLGLVVASISSMIAGRNLWASIFFVAALGFKQMALYYAPVIFAYLLGTCIFPRINLGRLLRIASITGISFALLVAPIYLGALYDARRGIDARGRPELIGKPGPLPILTQYSYMIDPFAWYYPIVQQTAQLLHRVFPFARGLFEDKVANFWCALNVLIKLKQYDTEILQRMSLLATLAAISIPCLILFLKPQKELLPLALASTSWAFFLFSFQVHEKSVLLPLMPMTLLLAAKDGLSTYTRGWVRFANVLGAWTMFPLLERVDLRVPYFVLTGLWAWGIGQIPIGGAQTNLATQIENKERNTSYVELGSWILHAGFYVAMAVWHSLEITMQPPANLPDLWVVVNVGIGAVGFGICYLWCVASLVIESGLFTRRKTASMEKKKA